MTRKILLTAAPGGHSGYAAAIAHYLREKGLQPVFIIARGDTWTKQKLQRYGETIEITMPRGPGKPLAKTLHRWPQALLESLNHVKRGYKVLVSCGSNLSLAPAIVAKTKGMKLVNIEAIVRITIPGKTPRLLHPIADTTLVHWPEQQKLLPGAVVVGPIYEPPRYKPRDEGYILVTAGTTGHKKLFDAIDKLDLPNIVLQTGKIDPEPYKKRHPSWTIFRFDPDLDRWIARASLVITHFPGMTSATAALAYRKPVILVAAPHLKNSAPQRDGPLYAEKIGALYVANVSPRSIAEAVKKATSLTPHRHSNGAEKAAKITAKLISTW